MPAFIATEPALSVVILMSFSPSVVLPMAPPNVVVPLSLTLKLRLVPLDLMVEPKVMATPFSVVLAPKVTASL